jgi:RNA polymerase sigma-70 factor, ECF subfamily
MDGSFQTRSQTTALLETAERGDADSLERLVPLIYGELRAMAHRQLMHEGAQYTLQTTALVHEAYLKLVDDTRVVRRGRAYFFGAAARAMRQVLVDRARMRQAQKRGGGQNNLSLTDNLAGGVDEFAAELIDLDGALERLAELNPRCVRVVECRFFAGLSVEETAEALDISPRTVKYDWALARAWLQDALRPDAPPDAAIS